MANGVVANEVISQRSERVALRW